jgi:hypothetical protein
MDCSYAAKRSFEVEIHVAQPPAEGFFAHQVKLRWQTGVLDYSPQPNIVSENLLPGCNISARYVNEPGGPPNDPAGKASVLFGCAAKPLPVSGLMTTGAILRFQFQCLSGISKLTLVPRLNDPQWTPPAGDPQLGTHFLDRASEALYPELSSATVHCVGPSTDSDLDGCTNTQEAGTSVVLGGQRDPFNYWDFYDTPAGNGLSRDRIVGLADIAEEVERFGASGDPATDPLSPVPTEGYHSAYDRGELMGPNAWNLAPPNGSISVGDIVGLVVQFGHTCAF